MPSERPKRFKNTFFWAIGPWECDHEKRPSKMGQLCGSWCKQPLRGCGLRKTLGYKPCNVLDWNLQCPSNTIWPFKIYFSQNNPSKCNPELKMRTSLEVLDTICPSSTIHTKIDESNFICPWKWRLKSWESLPLLPHYHLCPWTCNFLDSHPMPLSSGSAVCFISITTHLNTKKYIGSLCFGCHSDTPNMWLLIRFTSH